MKVGEKVQITDLSYGRTVDENGKVEGLWSTVREKECSKTPATLIAVNCVLPGLNGDIKGNNAIVQICSTGRLVFIQERFLELAGHTLVLDGKEITISDKSYRELKQHFTK